MRPAQHELPRGSAHVGCFAMQVAEEDLQRVAQATGAAVQTTVNELDPRVLGTCRHFEEVQVRYVAGSLEMSLIDLLASMLTSICCAGASLRCRHCPIFVQIVYANVESSTRRNILAKRVVWWLLFPGYYNCRCLTL